MRSITGNVAWITGGGTGIGRAAALALAGAGARIVVSGRRRAPLEETAAAIAAGGGEAHVRPLDVADPGAVAEVVRDLDERIGRLDILVNSAGINVPERFWSEISTESWQQVVRTNLDGAFYCIREALPMLRRQGDGLIINVSSWAGRYDSRITGPAYSATKHAMNAMNASLNIEEFRNGVRACVICPGEVATPILDNRPSPVSDQEKARMLQPEDVGDAILFVACQHPRVCLNEIVISPTWNRTFVRPGDTPALQEM